MSGHLSPHITTDASGNVIGTQAHYPFGEKWYETGTTTKYKFTTYERDPETGNDYAMARYHVNRLGRFSSVDPLAGDISDPQSLNRSAYTENDPENSVDPSGLGPPIVIPPARSFGGGLFDATNEFDLLGGAVNGDFGVNPTTIDMNGDPVQIDDPGAIFNLPDFGSGNLGGAISIAQPAKPPITKDCKKALKVAGQTTQALDNAAAYWTALQTAADYQGVDVSILASVAIRENGLTNSPEKGGGGGQGWMQLDKGTWGVVPWASDPNPEFAFVAAAGTLRMNIRYYQNLGYGPWGQLAGGIRAYNAGYTIGNRLRAVDQTGISQFADRYTAPYPKAPGNYVSNVLAIARDCFNFPQ